MERYRHPTLINIDHCASGGLFNEAAFINWIISHHFGVRSYTFGVGNAGRTSEHTNRR